MSPLFESIKFQNGNFHRLNYHQQRMDCSVRELLGEKNSINLAESLNKHEPPKTGLYKCRIVYTKQIKSIEFIPYQIKPVNSLKVVHDQEVTYAHKYNDRSKIEMLFSQRQYCDDILIIKNGLVTDSSYSNIIFYDGINWITPEEPLLNGTMRQFLLDTAEIKSAPVSILDISSFKSFRLINAMLAFDGPEIDVSRIVF